MVSGLSVPWFSNGPGDVALGKSNRVTRNNRSEGVSQVWPPGQMQVELFAPNGSLQKEGAETAPRGDGLRLRNQF